MLKRIVVGSRDVNVGNIVMAIAWTAAVVGLTLFVMIVVSWRAGGNPLLVLAGVDGHLSLAQTQVACWTVAAGSIVLAYGLVRLEVPTIPTSLLVLMGASLVTGGLAYFRDARNSRPQAQPVPAPRRIRRR